jgi:hypothetical protein
LDSWNKKGARSLAPLKTSAELRSAGRVRDPSLHGLVPDSIHERPQLPRARWMAQFSQRLGFDLADAFAGYCERLADFFERVLRQV